MQKKYIKVTEKDKSPFIALASNEQFYKNRGAKIEDPTQEEIEKCFPEEAGKKIEKPEANTGAKELKAEKAAHEATKQSLDAEILAHNETKQKLEAANSILQSKNEELEAVKAELENAKTALQPNLQAKGKPAKETDV